MPIYLLTNKYIVCIFLSMQSMHIATADTTLNFEITIYFPNLDLRL